MAGQIFGIVNARYLRNSQTQIHQIYRKFLTQPSAHNGGKFVLKCRKGGRGETPPKNKMNVKKLKSDQNIW